MPRFPAALVLAVAVLGALGDAAAQAPPGAFEHEVFGQEGWIEQRLAGDRIGLLARRYDLNTEFYLLPAATVRINSSFGTGPEFSESGRSGPSLFPDTQIGGRLEVKALPSLIFRAAVFAAAHNGNEYLQAQRRDGLRAERSEVTIDRQYVIDPDTDPTRANALVGAVRLTASF